jgi:hypothetical protein
MYVDKSFGKSRGNNGERSIGSKKKKMTLEERRRGVVFKTYKANRKLSFSSPGLVYRPPYHLCEEGSLFECFLECNLISERLIILAFVISFFSVGMNSLVYLKMYFT